METTESRVPRAKTLKTTASSVRMEMNRPGPASWKLRKRARKSGEGVQNPEHSRMRMDVHDTSPVDHPMNPLIIPEIVANLMKFMGLPQLIQCRLVSKLWSNESKRELIANHPLKIHSKNCDKLQDFLELIKTNPWSKSKRLNIYLDFRFHQHIKELEEIFNLHGPRLTNMSIEAYFISKLNVDIIRDTLLGHLDKIEYLKLNVPVSFLKKPLKMKSDVELKTWDHLTKLELNLFIGNQGEDLGFASNLLQRMPNLETLILAPFTELYIDFVASMTLASVLEIVCDVHPAHLKHLSLRFKIPESSALRLLKTNFHLNSLYISNLSSFKLNFNSSQQNQIYSTQDTYAGVPSELLLEKLKGVLININPSILQTVTEVNCLQFLRSFQSTLATEVLLYNDKNDIPEDNENS